MVTRPSAAYASPRDRLLWLNAPARANRRAMLPLILSCRFPASAFDVSVERRASRDKGETMRYMSFIKHTEDYRNTQVPAGLYEAMGEFVGEAMKRGQIVDTA